MLIEKIENGNKGEFVLYESDVKAGFIKFTRDDKNNLVIEHTEVFAEFGGRGFGRKLIMAVVEYARKNNIKIALNCPYAKSVFDKTEEIRDVLAE